MRVGRLSLLVGLLILFVCLLLLSLCCCCCCFLLSLSGVLSLPVMFPLSLPHVCFPLSVFIFLLPCSSEPDLLICVRAHTYMQIIVFVNIHMYACIYAYKYFEWVLEYKHVIWTMMHKKISSVIICLNVLFSPYSVRFLIFLENSILSSESSSPCAPACTCMQSLDQESPGCN